MPLFKNILFPTDFSPHARSALKYAAAFARAAHGRVILFSVQTGPVPANLMTLPEHVFEDQDSKWLLDLRREVKSLLTDPMFSGLEVEPVIVEGEPAPEIARAVREYDIDLVTVVTHGRRGISRAMFGSTAEEIIAEALHPYPKDLVIATKGGLLRPSPPQWVSDARPEHLRRALEAA